MYPILTRYGSIFIYSFTAILGAGLIVAVFITYRLQREQGGIPGWFDAMLAAFVGALLGGRVGFVLGHWAYFMERPNESLEIWRGGLSYHGACLGAVAGLLIFTRLIAQRFYVFGALFSIGAALLSAAGWLACLLDGCAYGRISAIGLLSANLADELGIYEVRYHAQLIGLILSLAALLVLWRTYRKISDKGQFWSAVLLLSSTHLVAGLCRGDDVYHLGSLRVDIILDGLAAVVSLLVLLTMKPAPDAGRRP